MAKSGESGQDGRVARLISRSGPLVALIFSLGMAAGALGTPGPVAAADPKVPAWDGGVNLYRKGVFTTQKSWLWCTAADVQIIRNIARRDDDHSTSGQRRYYNWMRTHNKYKLPQSAGVDPQGWTAGLRHFVDDRYRLVSSKTFDEALRSAVTNLRRTNLPVAVAVSRGNHGWVLTGFTATADPLKTTSFKVTSVRVTGPLFGLQSKNGYDMRPNTKLTTAQFRRFFTPWRYAPKRMIWDGRYVSIQPIAKKAAAVATPRASVAPKTAASPTPTLAPSASPSPSPSATASAASTPSAQPTPASTSAPALVAAAIAASPGTAQTEAANQSLAVATVAEPILVLTLAALGVVGLLAVWQVGVRGRRPTRRPTR
jgi:hypothetical protein